MWWVIKRERERESNFKGKGGSLSRKFKSFYPANSPIHMPKVVHIQLHHLDVYTFADSDKNDSAADDVDSITRKMHREIKLKLQIKRMSESKCGNRKIDRMEIEFHQIGKVLKEMSIEWERKRRDEKRKRTNIVTGLTF